MHPQVVQAIAGSSAAANGSLRYVDCAFSAALTDVAVVALVNAAPKLERLNLRGCQSVSPVVYNETVQHS